MRKGAGPLEDPTVDWHAMLAYALTGQWLVLPEGEGAPPAPDPDRLLADLAALGWSGTRLAESATTRRVLPVEQIRVLGPARWTSVLEDLRRRVLSEAADVRTVSRRSMNVDEQRLASDRPPHWA